MAKKLIKESLSNYEKNLGQKHYLVAFLLNSLGEVYLLEGDLKNSEAMFTKASIILLEYKHPERYKILENFSNLFFKKSLEAADKKDMETAKNLKTQAINNLKQALEIVKIHFPEDSLHIARIKDKFKKLK